MRRKSTTQIVVHCSATRPHQHWTAADVDELHRKNGWSGIGYAAVIRRDGLIEFGRHFDDVGAHVKGRNSDTVGVCLIGGLKADGTAGEEFEDTFTYEQAVSLRVLLPVLLSAYPSAQVVGHRDLSPDLDGDGIIERHEWLKECPTFDAGAWWAES